MGIFGKPSVASLQSKGDVKALQKVLLGEASRVSRDSSGGALPLVIDSAGALLDLDATDVLRDAFRDGLSSYCIQEVLKAFESRSPEKARPFLINLWFSHKNHELRKSVASHLSTMPRTRLDAGTVAALVAVLRGSPRDDIDERAMAARCLTGVQDADAVAALVGSFNTPWEPVRSAAAAALRGMDDGEKAAVAPALLRALQSEHAYERRTAINALSALGGTDAVEPIAQLLTDPDPSVRSEAAHALAAYGDLRGRDVLIAETESKDHDRVRAVAALDTLWSAGDIPTLVRLLRDPADKVHRSAARKLAALGWEPRMDEDGAYYFLATGDEDACLRVGAAATKPLMDCLAEAWLWMTNYRALLRVAAEVADRRMVPMLQDLVKKERAKPASALRLDDGIELAIRAITSILERSTSVADPAWIELVDLATLPLGRDLIAVRGKLDVLVVCPSCQVTMATRDAYRAGDASFLVCPRCGDDWLVRSLTRTRHGANATPVA